MIATPVIFEELTVARAAPEEMDAFWAAGWRHFGRMFFRYSVTTGESGGPATILPLRIDLAAFRPGKSQRRVLRRNADVRIESGPAVVDASREAMFRRHRGRFRTNIPPSLRTFFPERATHCVPCECRELRMIADGRLVAVSYLDIGADAVSSVYAMFEPDASRRSPGICTLLHEIEFARASGRRFLYPGYATVQPGHYDYKKSFAALHGYDWRDHQWHPIGRFLPGARNSP